jgi:hypothetical protein
LDHLTGDPSINGRLKNAENSKHTAIIDPGAYQILPNVGGTWVGRASHGVLARALLLAAGDAVTPPRTVRYAELYAGTTKEGLAHQPPPTARHVIVEEFSGDLIFPLRRWHGPVASWTHLQFTEGGQVTDCDSRPQQCRTVWDSYGSTKRAASIRGEFYMCQPDV